MVVAQLKEPTLVYQAKAFGQMLNHLSKQPLIALDTESDSLYRYQPRVCLIQISTLASPDVDPAQVDENEVVDYLVDPLRLEDISPLGMLLADPAIEVLMHAAENDILELSRDFGFMFQHVFDTQLAARILGWPRVGLAAILEEKFGVISDKRMQRTDWGKRPLTPQQITYAQMDTHFLPTLRMLLIQQLQAVGREEEAQEAFTLLSRISSQHARTNNGRSVWSMKMAREVPRPATGVLEALWQWRGTDGTAPKLAAVQDYERSSPGGPGHSSTQRIARHSAHQRLKFPTNGPLWHCPARRNQRRVATSLARLA